MIKRKYKGLLVIFLFSYVLNFIWENLHFSLYSSNIIGISNYLLLMLYAAFVDSFWIIMVYLLISIIDRDSDWKLNNVNITLFSVLLIAIAIFIERFALSTGRWAYSPYMPTIFGIGISPLFQLVITGWICLLAMRRLMR